MANIRAAYAEVSAAALTDDTNASNLTVNLKQTQDNWQTDGNTTIAGVKISSINVTKNGNVVVAYDNNNHVVTIGGQTTSSDYGTN